MVATPLCERLSKKESKIMKKCVLCGKEFSGYGNNAEPLKKGVCCDECNQKVILERILLLTK